jgi:Type II CAAX prenyl endopeptidase Rce1-like
MPNDILAGQARSSDAPSFHRRLWPIAVIGTFGLLSLLLQPVPLLLLEKAPALAALPPMAQRAALLVNPLVLLWIAAIVGAALAHRLGLTSALAGTSAPTTLRALAKAAALGIGMGLVLAGVDAAIAPHLGAQFAAATAAASKDGVTVLAIGVLYGGLTEEVILRWGVMTFIAWGLVAILGRQRLTTAIKIAIIVAAGIFAAAHLPALSAQVELTPPLILRTLLINAAAGLVYGWLFWRRHLEAAMVAHAATHVGLAAWRLTMA